MLPAERPLQALPNLQPQSPPPYLEVGLNGEALLSSSWLCSRLVGVRLLLWLLLLV
jgi:hypothetical protein